MIMGMPKGYAGKVAIINLTEQKAQIQTTEVFFREYGIDPRLWLGGDGVITKILSKDLSGPVDPLDPENEIIIATGPWTGTAAPWGSRTMLGCLGPETGGFESGSFGWVFPAVMKYAGFDIVIIRGKAKKPVYVFIDDQTIFFKDAAHLWGKETGETVKAIRAELGENYEGEIRVLSTSIAGEHLVPYAPPCADGTSCPGRTGAGAVMGSKNFKALAVRGTGELAIDNPMKLLDAAQHACDIYLSDPLIKLWQEHGATTYLLTVRDARVNGNHIRENALAADFPHMNNVGCLNCPGRCYHWLQIKEGPYAGTRQLGGHMTFFYTGQENLRLDNLEALIYYERVSQELGLDPASFSQAFNWAVECFEQGILTEKETDGLVLRWGDEDLVWEVMRRIAYREGYLGELLAQGVAGASQKIGKGSEDIAPHVRGKPYLLKDARLQALVWALGFLTSPRGGDWLRCHNVFENTFFAAHSTNQKTFLKYVGKTSEEVYRILMDKVDIPMDLRKRMFGDPPKVDVEWMRKPEGKALITVWSEDLVGLFNSLVTCMYGATGQYLLVGVGPTTFSEILNHITGWNTDYEEVMRIGERVLNAQRLLNYRLKRWDRKQDRFADKRCYEVAKTGIYAGRKVPWEKALDEYYQFRGWSERGLPTMEKLKKLQIEDLAEGLEEKMEGGD
jgi:aldehyde:ferredoxin oxidoreductase